MATIYDCILDYGGYPEADYASTTPYWIVSVFRMKFPTTYNRLAKESISQTFSDAVTIRGKPLIITDDCVRLDVSSTKTSYLQQMQASFLDSGFNYIGDIFPGDYVFVWMFTNKEDFQGVLNRLNQFGPGTGSACNGFKDGLKFFGRVQSMRKSLIQNPGGPRMSRYNLQAVGFEAFDAQTFYDPYLAGKVPAIGQFFAKLQSSVNEFAKKQQGYATVSDAVPFWLDLLLGKGVPPNLGTTSVDPRLQAATGLEAGHSYIIPQECGIVLNKTTASQDLLRYSDVLETIIGIQSYQPTFSSDSTNLTQVISNFQPQGTDSGGSRRFTPYDMLGAFIAQQVPFTGKNVWSILRQYVNPAINEMYTCLRVNPDGDVVPTLVVRQLPFTSKLLNTTLNVTRFLEVPRWGIANALISQVEVGRSDALRFNFVHVYGDSVDPIHGQTSQMVQQGNQPIRDDLDISRSGLRAFQTTIPCHPIDGRNGSAGRWMAISSDIVMGQQLTLNGTMTTYGIQAPICVGDNLEWDNMVFHIEGLQHSCFISGDGIKSFRTTLNLSHGVADQQNPAQDIDLYTAVPRTFNPQTTRDTTLGDPDDSAPLSSTTSDLNEASINKAFDQGAFNGGLGLDLTQDPATDNQPSADWGLDLTDVGKGGN